MIVSKECVGRVQYTVHLHVILIKEVDRYAKLPLVWTDMFKVRDSQLTYSGHFTGSDATYFADHMSISDRQN